MIELKPYYSEEDIQLIVKSYNQLLRIINKNLQLSNEDITQIRFAFLFGAKAHCKQRRKSGEPYFLHPLEVAKICCKEIGLSTLSIVCALLHDVVEDTEITLENITEHFGKDIARIVDGLTKLDGSYKLENRQAENFKKILSTLVHDVRVVLIKLSDRLHNMRTIDAVARHKQLKIGSETKYIYSPLAYRLGLYNMKTEFDDICLKISNREIYDEISQRITETKEEREKYIRRFVKPLKKALTKAKIKNRIYGRVKSISSIENKIRTKHVTFEEVYDMFAIRVIIDAPLNQEKTQCWQVYSIITDSYQPVTERLRDWISTPKSNGYESLHTTILGLEGKYIEVQIRSERMEEVAEKGVATHWKYKGLNSLNAFGDWIDNIKDVLENKDNSSAEFLSDFRTNLFNKEVYIYTPKGDLKIFPQGATVLDYAFSIHTDIGYHCYAIKVNNKLVPMGYKLRNGDQVTVITNKNQKPSEDWLKMVITGRARSKIRTALKEEEKKIASLGRESVIRKFKNLKVSALELNVDKIVKRLKYASHLNFYADIAQGNIQINEVLKDYKVEGSHLVFIKPEKVFENVPLPPNANRKKEIQAKLLVEGQPADQYKYQLASCCNPVQGDDVFAFLTKGAGVKIHRTNCPNGTHLMANYGYRIMKAEWSGNADTKFTVQLKIIGIDDGPGVIEKITMAISSEMGINIRSFSISGDEGYFEGKIGLMVANKNQLNVAIRKLRALENISNVVREDV